MKNTETIHKSSVAIIGATNHSPMQTTLRVLIEANTPERSNDSLSRHLDNYGNISKGVLV